MGKRSRELIGSALKLETRESGALPGYALILILLAGLLASLGLMVSAPNQIPHSATLDVSTEEQFVQLLFSGSRPESLELNFSKNLGTQVDTAQQPGVVFSLGAIAVSESGLGRRLQQTQLKTVVTSKPCRQDLRIDFGSGEMVASCGQNGSFQRIDLAGFETGEQNLSGLAWIESGQKTTLVSIQVVGPSPVFNQSLARELLRAVALLSVFATPLISLMTFTARKPKQDQRSREPTGLGNRFKVLAALILCATATLVLAPEKTDDGWNLAILKASGRNGVLSSVFGENWSSGFGEFWFSIVRLFLGSEAAIFDIRMLATVLVAGTLLWTVLFLRQIEPLGKLSRIGLLSGIVIFQLFAGSYVLSSRPEVFVGFLLALLIYFAQDSANPDNILARLIVALATALAIATHPSGFVLLPGFLFLIATWWRTTAFGRHKFISSFWVPVSFFSLTLVTQMFWTLDLRAQADEALEVGSNHRYGIFDEIERFRWITEHVSAAEASMFALLVVAIFAISYVYVRGHGHPLNYGIAVATLAPFGLIFTPSKWWHHYGALLPLVLIGLYLVFRYLSKYPVQNWVLWTGASLVLVLIVGTFSYSEKDFGYLEELGWNGVSYQLLERFGPAPLILMLLAVITLAKIARGLDSRRIHYVSLIFLLLTVSSTAVVSFGFRAVDAVVAKEWVLSNQLIEEASGRYDCGFGRDWQVIDLEASGKVSIVNARYSTSIDTTSPKAVVVFSPTPQREVGELELEVGFFISDEQVKSTLVEAESVDQGFLLPRLEVEESSKIVVTALDGARDFFVGVIEFPAWVPADAVIGDARLFLGPEEIGRYPCANFAVPRGGIWSGFDTVIANQSRKNFLLPSSEGTILFPISEPRLNGDVMYSWTHLSESGLFLRGSMLPINLSNVIEVEESNSSSSSVPVS